MNEAVSYSAELIPVRPARPSRRVSTSRQPRPLENRVADLKRRMATVASPQKRQPGALYLVFLGAVFYSLVLVAGMVITDRSPNWDPNLLSTGLPIESAALSNLSIFPASKDDFLVRLTRQDRKVVAGQVHFISSLIAARNKGLEMKEANQLAAAIVVESRRVGLDPLFVAAIIKHESTFKNRALSTAGARGLMQLLPSTAEYVTRVADISWHGEHRLSDPAYNIRLGVSYVKYLLAKFDSPAHVLIAYNWGPANLANALKAGERIPGEPVDYARRILKDHARWTNEYTARAQEFRYLNVEALLG